jgi:hypothetical protein
VPGLLPSGSGWEDDLAFANRIGFTDIIKRPTVSGKELRAEEYAYRKSQLVEKLEIANRNLVIFTFKNTATILFWELLRLELHRQADRRRRGVRDAGAYAPSAVVQTQLAELTRSVSIDEIERRDRNARR